MPTKRRRLVRTVDISRRMWLALTIGCGDESHFAPGEMRAEWRKWGPAISAQRAREGLGEPWAAVLDRMGFWDAD